MDFKFRVFAGLFVSFLTLPAAQAASEFLPVHASTWAQTLNPLLDELPVGYQAGSPKCDEKNNFPRRVCIFHIGPVATITAAVPQDSDRIHNISLVCRSRENFDPLACLSVFAVTLRSVSPGQSRETVAKWMQALMAIMKADAAGSILVDRKEIWINTVRSPELTIRPADTP